MKASLPQSPVVPSFPRDFRHLLFSWLFDSFVEKYCERFFVVDWLVGTDLQGRFIAMKKNYHLDFSSHDEVICRNHEDYIYTINTMALSALRHDTMLMAYSVLSDHLHIAALTEDPSAFMHAFRLGLTSHFNSKYCRNGRLGEKSFFCSELNGPEHILACTKYILRNAQHHGLTPSPYAYPYSSINEYFRDELGKGAAGIFSPDSLIITGVLPVNRKLPEGFRVTGDGQISPRNFLNANIIEGYFGSSLRFVYFMNRPSGEEWEIVQKKENGKTAINLYSMEPGYSNDEILKMLKNEEGRFAKPRVTDMELCSLIDNRYVKRVGKRTYCQLTAAEKSKVVKYLLEEKHLPLKQVTRCLGL